MTADMKNNPEPVRPDLEAALRRAFPKNEVVAQPKFEDSYLAKSYDKLHHRLSQIKGAEILYEQDSEGVEESPYISSPTQWDDEDGIVPKARVPCPTMPPTTCSSLD